MQTDDKGVCSNLVTYRLVNLLLKLVIVIILLRYKIARKVHIYVKYSMRKGRWREKSQKVMCFVSILR